MNFWKKLFSTPEHMGKKDKTEVEPEIAAIKDELKELRKMFTAFFVETSRKLAIELHPESTPTVAKFAIDSATEPVHNNNIPPALMPPVEYLDPKYKNLRQLERSSLSTLLAPQPLCVVCGKEISPGEDNMVPEVHWITISGEQQMAHKECELKKEG